MSVRIAAIALATLVSVPAAFAEDVTVIRRDGPAVERSTVIEKRSVESTGSVGGCRAIA